MSIPATHASWSIQHPLKPDFANLTLGSRPTPKPTGKQVLIRVKAVSLNARDCQIASGTYPAPIQVEANIVPGSDAAGDVVAVGDEVTRVKLGDRVMPIFAQSFLHGDHDPDYQKQGLGGGIDGVLAEYFICDESGLVHIPESLNYVEASTLVVAALTSWHSLYAHPGAVLLPGETVLVLGTGGVSIFAAQIALAAGCKVIATSSSDEKLARAKALGVQGGVNYRTHKEWHEEVLKLNGGRGVDHVIEVGGKGTLQRSIRSTRPGGNVWIIGYMSDYKEAEEEKVEFAKEILYTQAVVRGVVCGSRDMFEAMNRAVEATKLKPVVDKVFKWEDTIEAYRYLDSGKHFGKVCIELA
ncbi:NAD-P-binding protein [Leucosporidium creatinivorum]|uniref:NAD-P-binding protein n=1 Tax=Leucosporidium creatinivorum TaxID=106004 RepID=A0A1Y2FVP8_9BASI|nr:NAD-P-binding protein [Leucosporidium creatinivorum]